MANDRVSAFPLKVSRVVIELTVEMDKLFKSFSQVDESITRSFGGSGMYRNPSWTDNRAWLDNIEKPGQTSGR
jgi:hypothetical protein